MKRTWLVEKRKEAGMHQRELAAKVGVSKPYISTIENGIRNPSGETAMKIADELGFPMEMFFKKQLVGEDSL